MNTLKESFVGLINSGVEAAEQIIEADKKANAYASLALAIATSGLLTSSAASAEVTGKDSLKAESGKGKKGKSKSKAKSKEEAPEEVTEAANETSVEEPVTEVPTEEVVEETENAEWDEANLEKFGPQIELLNQYFEEWTTDYVINCLKTFMEDSTITAENVWDFVRPTNIDAFLNYLASLAETE